jgi:hypothetical protein
MVLTARYFKMCSVHYNILQTFPPHNATLDATEGVNAIDGLWGIGQQIISKPELTTFQVSWQYLCSITLQRVCYYKVLSCEAM